MKPMIYLTHLTQASHYNNMAMLMSTCYLWYPWIHPAVYKVHKYSTNLFYFRRAWHTASSLDTSPVDHQGALLMTSWFDPLLADKTSLLSDKDEVISMCEYNMNHLRLAERLLMLIWCYPSSYITHKHPGRRLNCNKCRALHRSTGSYWYNWYQNDHIGNATTCNYHNKNYRIAKSCKKGKYLSEEI